MLANAYRAKLAVALAANGTETEVFVDSLETMTGEPVTFASFSPFTRGILTIDPEATNSDQPEFVSFTGVDSTAISFTGVTRGLSSLSNSVVTANKVFHPVRTPVIIAFGSHNIKDIIDYLNAEIATAAFGTANVVSGVAGEDLTQGNLVYLKNDGKWWKTDADTLATVSGVQLGIVQATTSTDATISGGVLVKGLDTHQSGLVAGTTYYASNTAGGISSSAGTNSRIIGVAKDTTTLYFDPDFGLAPSIGEKAAMAGGGNYGTPSSTNKFLTKAVAATTEIPIPTVKKFLGFGYNDNNFTITNPSGTTFRYTFIGDGENPGVFTDYMKIGDTIYLNAQNFNAANNGTFVITAVGSDYFEITNASGVAETNKTIGTGKIVIGGTIWTKPAGLKYIRVRGVGGGGAGGSSTASNEQNMAGGGGGYFEKIIPASSLGDTETVTIGAGGIRAANSGGTSGGTTSFGSHCSATGGEGGSKASQGAAGSAGGNATGGDLNIPGQNGGSSFSDSSEQLSVIAGGGNSMMGYGGFFRGVSQASAEGRAGRYYGAGGAGSATSDGTDVMGGSGSPGCLIVEEHYI